jgi:hypothetical protein
MECDVTRGEPGNASSAAVVCRATVAVPPIGGSVTSAVIAGGCGGLSIMVVSSVNARL